MTISHAIEADAPRQDLPTRQLQNMGREHRSWSARPAVSGCVADRQSSSAKFRQVTECETPSQAARGALDLDLRIKVERAAFEAAYMEMTKPDPASSRFVALVATHRERLWAESRRCREKPFGDGRRMSAAWIAGLAPSRK